MPNRTAERQRRVTYRAERFDVHFNVKVTREVRAALRAGAAAADMPNSHFGRMVIDLGLGARRASGMPSVVQRRIPYGTGALFDFQISRKMRAALSAGAAADDLSVSDFARMVIDLGLAAWRARRTANIRHAGET